MKILVAMSAAMTVFLGLAMATGNADKLAIRLPGAAKHRIPREVWLRQAGVNVTPLQFWVVSAVAAFAVEIACWSVAGAFVVGVMPALAAGLGPRAYFGRRRTTRLNAVVEAWPQAIRDFDTTIGARRSVHHALLELARTGPEATRLAFADYEALAAMGGTPSALATIRHQLADSVSDRVIELLIVAHTQGQALTLKILRDQAAEVTKDLRTAAEIRVEQAEPRIVAGAAAVMPWAGLVIMCSGIPAYREFYSGRGGIVFIVIAGAMTAAGLLIASRLIKETAEPRVLGDD